MVHPETMDHDSVRTGSAPRRILQNHDAQSRGQEFPNVGVFLEVVPNEKLVFTDGYLAGWEPNPNHFFTAILTWETLSNGRTRYTARARHWTKEACEKHAAMGFIDGWRKAFDQLVELVGK